VAFVCYSCHAYSYNKIYPPTVVFNKILFITIIKTLHVLAWGAILRELLKKHCLIRHTSYAVRGRDPIG